MKKIALLAALVGIMCCRAIGAAPTPPPDDRFIAGYAAAVLERDFHLPASVIVVEGGVIHIAAKDLEPDDQAKIKASLSSIPGVKDVAFGAQAPVTPPAAANEPITMGAEPSTVVRTEPTQPWRFLAPINLFDPLLADPRWPNFSLAYDDYLGKHRPLGDVISVSFGDSISLYESKPKPSGQFEIGVQAAVFAIFDLDAPSFDLVNADYFVGPVAEYRNGDFSSLLRVYHQSSHVGDEFLLDHPGFQRVNLSYEEVDAILSYDMFHKSLRAYGGGGYLFGVDPSDLKRWALQYGLEYHGPEFGSAVRMFPVAALDLQNREENDWATDISARIGIQFEDATVWSRRMLLMLEFYDGHSPNGQFFHETIRYVGIGLHFYS